jgi:hypothetical protein
MTKEQFDKMIMPLWLIDNNKHRVFLMEAIFGNFKKWQEENPDPKIYGVYSPENDLLEIHKTKEGAEKSREICETEFRQVGFYIDEVELLD